MTEDQARLNAASLSRTLRVGRQMTAFTDALFGGKPVTDPPVTTDNRSHPMPATNDREVETTPRRRAAEG